jgi:hypothetical protein
MNRTQLLSKLHTAWQAFHASYAGLPDDRLVAPGVTGDWSVKDLIAHIAWWEEEALAHLPTVLAGGRPPRYSTRYGGIDAFNAQMADRMRDLTLDEVRNRAAETHRRLIAYLETVPEDQLTRETRFRRRLRLDTYSHYPIHTEAIQAWRQRQPAG